MDVGAKRNNCDAPVYFNFRIATPPDIISSFPSPPAPAGHPVSLVSAYPLTYTFPYLLSAIISLCTNVHLIFFLVDIPNVILAGAAFFALLKKVGLPYILLSGGILSILFFGLLK